MKTSFSIAELLALVAIVEEHVGRNYPGFDPPRLLREIQQKLDGLALRHRRELDSVKPTDPNTPKRHDPRLKSI